MLSCRLSPRASNCQFKLRFRLSEESVHSPRPLRAQSSAIGSSLRRAIREKDYVRLLAAMAHVALRHASLSPDVHEIPWRHTMCRRSRLRPMIHARTLFAESINLTAAGS